MADKIVKAFEALRSHYLQESAQSQQPVDAAEAVETTPSNTNKKKDVALSKRERINYCNAIADFLPMQTVKDINEFPRLLTLAMELLLVCCDDNEGDVRLVAGECINKITKAFIDSNIGRIQVELYKEIKKNGSSRSLRAALQRFGDTCHLIRVHKCRPYVANLLPCIVKIVKRNDDSVQEVLGAMMLKLCPVLGNFMNESDIKILLKSYLPNLKSTSAVCRRTAASTLNSICHHSRKPTHFYSWLISMLLGMITPLTEDLPTHTILGVLLCFRNIIPHLMEVEHEEMVMKGSFGAKKSPFSPSHGKDRTVEKKQYLQIYEVTMFCTKHKDHNVVTASLENLYQVLLCQAKPLLEILLSPSGIAPTITGQLTALSQDVIQRSDSPLPSESGDSGVNSDMNSDMLSEKGYSTPSDKLSLAEFSLGETGQSLDSALYSDIPKIPAVKVSSSESSLAIPKTDDTITVEVGEDDEEDLGLRLPRTYTQGSFVNVEAEPVSFQRNHLASNVSDVPDNISETSIDELYRGESISSVDIRAVIERQFNFDAVTCTGVPVLHCIRLMCSFLLDGQPGKTLPDSKTRVSVKSLALHCISAALKLFPEALLAKVVPDDFMISNKSSQLVRDIFLFTKHSDQQIRGALAGIIGHFIAAVIERSNGDVDQWINSMTKKYSTKDFVFKDCIDVLKQGFSDESAVAIKLSCLAVKNCIIALSNSSYNVLAYDLVWNLIGLSECSYWLVKAEILEVFQKVNFKLMSVLEKPWMKYQEISKLNEKFVCLQMQFTEHVLIPLLGDEDARVRHAASMACVRILPNLYCTIEHDDNVTQYSLLKADMYDEKKQHDQVINKMSTKEKTTVEANLSYIVRSISETLTCAKTKYLIHGCTQCLYYLSEAYPVIHFPYAWETFPSYVLKVAEKNMRSRTYTATSRQLDFSAAESRNSSTGLLTTVFSFISSSWLTFDLQAHQEALKLCVHILCGCSYQHLNSKSGNTSDEAKNEVDNVVGELLWNTLKDADLIAFTKKLFSHLTRILSVLSFVIDQTNPMANLPKMQIGLQSKDKTPVPGVATIASPSPNSSSPASSMNTTTAPSPRKFTLTKAMHRRQGSEASSTDGKSVENTPDSKTNTPSTPSAGSSGDKNEKIGFFQHIPHYMKLYEVLKGAHKNYQVSTVTVKQEKFCAFVRGVLESLSLLFELATFNELGAYADEFLEYLKATAKIEEEVTFLAVQQLLKGLFGTNVASQPDVFKLAESTKHLVQTHGDPTFVYNFDMELPDVVEKQKDLHSTCFVYPYQEICESLKMVPLVDASATERGSRALSFIRNIKKNITIPHRPTAKVSKERVSSIQSYIRLFEPLVIHALKAYTTTSSTQLQCQAIHLLDQLIRLRVNYSLLDSDQVFIGFVLKQFEFIESGQIIMPELFVPTVFQFLVLLSYECYQPKFTQAKAIIGMPRIIRLCDEIMACGQPAVTHAIPALKPIVQDLFATASQVRADTGKDLDAQREVVVSMLLRVIQYPDVLGMLTQVLNGCKSDGDKWKRLSRQITDVLLPSLSKLEVQLVSIDGLNYLTNLLDALAPLSLRPADIILKALFELKLPISDKEVLNSVSMVIALLRTLIMQNSEDIIFSRIQQLDASFIRSSFLLNSSDGEFLLKTRKDEQTSANYISSFLIYILQIALNEFLQIQQTPVMNKPYLKVLTKLIDTYLMLLVYIGKTGNYHKLASNLLSMLFTPMESTDHNDTSVLHSLTRKFSHIQVSQPILFLRWLQVLQTLGVSDVEFWREFCKFDDKGNTVDNLGAARMNDTWKEKLNDQGTLLLYCEIIVAKLKEQKNLDISLVAVLLNKKLKEIVMNMKEPPIKELVCRVLQNNELTALFIQSLSQLLTSPTFKIKPVVFKSLLHHLECVDLTYSSTIVQLLFSLIPCIKVYGLARKAETLACRRIDYLQSLTTAENAFDFNEFQGFTKNPTYVKRYPRLCSLIQRVTKCEECDIPKPTVHCHPLAPTQVDVKKYQANKEWMYKFAETLCYTSQKTDVQAYSAVKILRSLNLQDIENIMMNEENGTSQDVDVKNQKFDIAFLETCIQEARLSGYHTNHHGRTVTSANLGLELLSLYDTGGSSESENKDRVQLITKKLLLKHINDIVADLTQTKELDSQHYVCYKEDVLNQRFKNEEFLKKYVILLKCLMQFLNTSCLFNQSLNLVLNDTYNIVLFVLLAPRFCLLDLKERNDKLEWLQNCFKCLSMLFHCQEFSVCLSTHSYAYLLSETINITHILLTELSLRLGEQLVKQEKLITGYQEVYDDDDNDEEEGKIEDDKSAFQDSCEKVSQMVHALSTTLSQKKCHSSRLPWYLLEPIRQTITGLARIPFVNSYARIPPIVWKFGWNPVAEGPLKTELPPLPVDILKEKEVLQDFVFRVNHVGWTSRMQFEETWAALLGVLSSPPMLDEHSSTDEEIELAQSSCLAVHCITSLLLDTTLAPVPGNVTISRYSVIHRHKDYPFLGSKAGKKLGAIRRQIELMYQKNILFEDELTMKQILYPVVPSLLSARQRKQQLIYGCMTSGKLFVSNLETPTDLSRFSLGQISASAIRTRLVTSDVQEDTDSDDSDSLIIKVKEKSPISNQPSSDSYKKLEELDIRSCLQFLLELFEQWLSAYAVPKTPLMLKMEAVKSLCILSDLLLELTHYEWILNILLDFTQTHPPEDDILHEYLMPTMCKALAVLKLEGVVADGICKHIDVNLRSPHIPLQISCLVGSLYILESYVNSTNIILVPILTDYISRKLLSLNDNVGIYSHRYLIVLWSVAFFLMENCSSEIQDPHFATTVLDTAIGELCKQRVDTSHTVDDVLFRGLERLAVSFALTRPECDRLAKLACNCVSSGSSTRLVSALALLCTCMYTGADAEQASGLSTLDFSVDAPINDSRLVVMERINVLLTRIRKGQLSEAVLLATILPRILLDFLPVQEVMNKLISEFLSSQQPRPELIAKIFNKVSDCLFKEGQELLVRDWVFLCIASFVQRTPVSMAVWSLTCFFISASSNPWLKSIFPYVVERKGKFEENDREIFCMAALDFYTNQNLEASQQQQFLQTFQSKAEHSSSSPYDMLIACCLQSTQKS